MHRRRFKLQEGGTISRRGSSEPQPSALSITLSPIIQSAKGNAGDLCKLLGYFGGRGDFI